MVAGRHGEAGTRRCPGNVWAGELCSGCVSLHVCPNPRNTRKWRGCQLGALVTTSVRADSLLVTGHRLAGTLSDRGCARGLGGCGNSLYFPANFAVNLRLLLETGYKTQKKSAAEGSRGEEGMSVQPGRAGRALGLPAPTSARPVHHPQGCHPALGSSVPPRLVPSPLEVLVHVEQTSRWHACTGSFPPCVQLQQLQQPRGHGLGQGTQRSSAERRGSKERAAQKRGWAFWLEGWGGVTRCP